MILCLDMQVLTVREILAYGVEDRMGARVELEEFAMRALTYNVAEGFTLDDLQEKDRCELGQKWQFNFCHMGLPCARLLRLLARQEGSTQQQSFLHTKSAVASAWRQRSCSSYGNSPDASFEMLACRPGMSSKPLLSIAKKITVWGGLWLAAAASAGLCICLTHTLRHGRVGCR